jgi:hypothetical protein
MVGHGPGPSSSLEPSSLDLAILINREDGVSGRIGTEADNVPELFGKLRGVRQLEGPDPLRRKPIGFENALHQNASSPRSPCQFPAGPVGCHPAWRPKLATRCTVSVDNGGLPGLRVLSRNSPLTPSAKNRACQIETAGLALPERRMISAMPQPSAMARMILARQTSLWRAPIHDDHLKPTTICPRDVDDNSCSHHPESLNCFGRLGNRPNESDHTEDY